VNHDEAIGKLRKRAEETATYLRQTFPEVTEQQRHLDDGSPERAYWHFGYLMALRDALKLLGKFTEGAKKENQAQCRTPPCQTPDECDSHCPLWVTDGERP
jgi:hypothetical protein